MDQIVARLRGRAIKTSFAGLNGDTRPGKGSEH
jgi:hypothetical protein